VRLRGIYAITDRSLTPGGKLVPAVRQALVGGVSWIQYRDKEERDGDRRLREVEALHALCSRFGAGLIVNDDIELAAGAGAEGVHLGRDDASIRRAREILGPDAVIGVSCYDDLSRAVAAEQDGADYVAFGSFFPSTVKPRAVRADPTLLSRARHRLHIPIAAIGGITAGNGAELVSAGADLLAVITGVFGAGDIREAARRLTVLYDPVPCQPRSRSGSRRT
jgi:thiamine-phosphate pyrophosphorylase